MLTHLFRVVAALLIAVPCSFALPSSADALGGMYVSTRPDRLHSNAAQVILMRHGTTTVLSMRPNYQGPPKDFAMVVPVPATLQRGDIRTLPHSIFDKVDILGAPRLVEYWEKRACKEYRSGAESVLDVAGKPKRRAVSSPRRRSKVRVKSKFHRGAYDITLLSAAEPKALESWLLKHKYNIPKGAAQILKEYTEQGMHFFVARVNPKKLKFTKGQANLPPLQFHYDSMNFSLPVRLGLLNANGKQDLIVNILAKKRYEVANHKNVTIPTNLIVKSSVKQRFAEFYASLFDHTLKQSPGAVVTEYAWQAVECVSCPSGLSGGREVSGPLEYRDLKLLGMDIANPHPKRYVTAVSEHSHLSSGPRENPAGFDAIRQLVHQRAKQCSHKKFAQKEGGYSTSATVTFKIGVHGATFSWNVSKGDPDGGMFQKCLQESLRKTDPSLVKGWGGDQAYAVTTHISMNSRAQDPHIQKRLWSWVLTRLHARYDSMSLKDDFVFQEASPVAGGRETPKGERPVLETGTSAARLNTFQGRYILLNRWKKQAKCDDASFGYWGRPPKGYWSPMAAQNTAFARRDSLKLRKAIVSKNVPGLPFTKHEKK